MAANMKDPRTFFSLGTPAQYEYVFNLYEEALKLKAEKKNKKVADFLKLDKWFQSELPKRIKSRGKDAHLVHEELVQCMKWKLARGKFSPRIKDLVQMNTPRLCMTETKKAFRALLKKDDLASAIQALCNLKGVGPAMASVMLTAADNTQCGFMADECLLAIPEIEGIDYTTKELLNFVEQLKAAANRLNSSGGSGWNAHKIEQTLWAHSVLNETNKELLDGMPPSEASPSENGTDAQTDCAAQKNGGDAETSSDSTSSANKENNVTNSNGTSDPSRQDEDTNTSDSASRDEDSKVVPAGQEDTNDSIATSTDSLGADNRICQSEEDSLSAHETNGNGSVSRALDDDSDATRDSMTDSRAATTGAVDSVSSMDADEEDSSLEPASKKAKLEEE